MLTIPNDANRKPEDRNVSGVPGTWHLEDYFITDPPTKIVVLTCPKCGKGETVWRPQAPAGFQHSISADGTVTPSVVCPHSGCGFHEFIKLGNWTGGDIGVAPKIG